MSDAGAAVKAYFESLDERFRRDESAGMDAVFQWVITGPGGGEWHAIIKDQALKTGRGRHAKPDFTLTIGTDDYLKLLQGQLVPGLAILTRKMKIAGDVALARRLEKVLPAEFNYDAHGKAPASRPSRRAPNLKAARMKGRKKVPPHEAQRVLVTGATGLLGAHVVRALVADGVMVKALVQPGGDTSMLEDVDVAWVSGDVVDGDAMDEAVDSCDTVIHCAGVYRAGESAEVYRVNVDGTRQVLEAALAAGLKKAVHVSSHATIGARSGQEEADEGVPFNHWGMVDDYVLSKQLAELEAMRFKARGLDVVVVNPTLVFGTGDRTPTPGGRLVQRLAKGESPFWIEGGFNAISAEDTARGILAAMVAGRPGDRYILAGTNMTWKDLAALVGQVANVKVPRWKAPAELLTRLAPLQGLAARLRRRDPDYDLRGLRFVAGRHLYVTGKKARRELGFTPGDVEVGIEAAVEWFCYGPGADR